MDSIFVVSGGLINQAAFAGVGNKFRCGVIAVHAGIHTAVHAAGGLHGTHSLRPLCGLHGAASQSYGGRVSVCVGLHRNSVTQGKVRSGQDSVHFHIHPASLAVGNLGRSSLLTGRPAISAYSAGSPIFRFLSTCAHSVGLFAAARCFAHFARAFALRLFRNFSGCARLFAARIPIIRHFHGAAHSKFPVVNRIFRQGDHHIACLRGYSDRIRTEGADGSGVGRARLRRIGFRFHILRTGAKAQYHAERKNQC